MFVALPLPLPSELLGKDLTGSKFRSSHLLFHTEQKNNKYDGNSTNGGKYQPSCQTENMEQAGGK